MQKNKLRKFIIYSVAFHIILISLILLYFYKNPITINSGKSGNVMVGVIKSEDLYSGNTSSDADQRDQDTLKKLDKEQSNKPATALKQTSANEIVENSKETNKITQATIDNKSKEKSSNSKRESVSETQTISNFDIETKTSPHIGKGPDSMGIPGSQGNAGGFSEIAYPDYSLNPKPKYPRTARKRGYEGEVKLKVYVLANGKVGEIKVIRPSGYEILDQSALEAVKKWVFVPGRENGKEISSWVTVPITFQLKSG